MLDFLEIAFVIVALWLAVTIIVKKFFLNRIFKDNIKSSEFVAFMGLVIMIYSVLAFVLVLFVPLIQNKIFILLYGLSPYIIGKFAKYEKENLFSIIQLVIVVISIIHVSSIYG